MRAGAYNPRLCRAQGKDDRVASPALRRGCLPPASRLFAARGQGTAPDDGPVRRGRDQGSTGHLRRPGYCPSDRLCPTSDWLTAVWRTNDLPPGQRLPPPKRSSTPLIEDPTRLTLRATKGSD